MRESAQTFALHALNDERMLGRFASLDEIPGLAHGVTTRWGANFSAPAVSDGFARSATELSGVLGLGGAAWLRQVHGQRVIVAETAGFAGEADALISIAPDLALIGRSADCPLILVAGPVPDGTARTGPDRELAGRPRACGMAHASWRGSVQQVTAVMVAALIELSGLPARSLSAAICPCAGPCCYEVGPEVRAAALAGIGSHAESFFSRRDGRLYFDLWRCNADQLLRAGIPAERIRIAGLCSICRGDLFPSYRREGAAAERIAAAIGWRRLAAQARREVEA